MAHPQLDLTNKTAVLIGGTSGIGLALTKGLAQAGANVVPTGRREDLVRKAASEVQTLGRRSLTQPCDVTDTASLDALLQAVCAEFGMCFIVCKRSSDCGAWVSSALPTLYGDSRKDR